MPWSRSRRARARQRRVVRRQQPGVAERAEVLAREEREAAERAEARRPAAPCRSRRSPAPHPRSTGMPDARGFVEDRIHVGAQAEQVHRHDRLRPRRDRARASAAGSMLNVPGSMSTSTGRAPTRTIDAGGREERIRRGHDLVARTDAERHQRQQQRVGARRHGDRVAARRASAASSRLERRRSRAP